MILVDAGPLIALFDRREPRHDRCSATLKRIRVQTVTTVAVLTEAFHILGPETRGSQRLRDLLATRALACWFFDDATLVRAFELMEQYADHPMDFADASLVVAAEVLDTTRVFTLDTRDFNAYRVRRGHRHLPFEIIP
jgi:predicted nucleic acid-binding protein